VSVADRVRTLVAPICSDLGLELYDVEHSPGRVRVLVDRPGGVDLEAIAVATRLISRELDQRDPVPGRYHLEVSSPGLERPLRTPAHYQHAIGQTVSVRLHPGADEPRRVGGTLVEADDDGLTVMLDGPDGPDGPNAVRRRIRYIDVERARTTFAWGTPPRPAKGPKSTRSSRVRPEEQEAAS
jgi:ribosome maturation factor RimP